MNYHALIQSINALHAESVGRAVSAVSQALVLRNWAIGTYIVEFEQNGEDRAEYGDGLLRRLSSDLGACGIKGVSPDMLERMRLFSRHYPQLANSISVPLVRISTKHVANSDCSISAPAVRKTATDAPTPLSPALVLRLTWTHLADLVRIDDPWKRAFYEIECLNGNWSKRQLQRQIGSLLYERTALSTDKVAVVERARQQSTETPSIMADLIRDPYVLEFTGLAERPHFRGLPPEEKQRTRLARILLNVAQSMAFAGEPVDIDTDPDPGQSHEAHCVRRFVGSPLCPTGISSGQKKGAGEFNGVSSRHCRRQAGAVPGNSANSGQPGSSSEPPRELSCPTATWPKAISIRLCQVREHNTGTYRARTPDSQGGRWLIPRFSRL